MIRPDSVVQRTVASPVELPDSIFVRPQTLISGSHEHYRLTPGSINFAPILTHSRRP